MSREPFIEWRFEEEPPQPPAEEPSSRQRFPTRLRWLFLSLGILVLLALSGLFLRYYQGQRALYRDLQAQLDRERQAIAAGDRRIFRTLLDTSTREMWQGWRENDWLFLAGQDLPLRVGKVHLFRSDLALVAVEGWPLANTIRLYRRVGGRWVWSHSWETDWGAALPPFDLPCATVWARARDENTAQALAQHPDALCAALERLMASDKAPGVKVELSLIPPDGAPYVDFTRARVKTPSPWFLTLDEHEQPAALVDLIHQMIDAREGIEAALASESERRPVPTRTESTHIQGTPEPPQGEQPPEHALRIVSLTYYRDGYALVYLEDAKGSEPGEIGVWWFFEKVDGRWQRYIPGTSRLWGPWLQRSGPCATVTYRAIDRAWVSEVWSLVQRMCRRGQDAFGVPIREGVMQLVIAPAMTGTETLPADVFVPSPLTWSSPVRQPLALRLARSITERSVPYFLLLNAARHVPPLLQGLTEAYLLPEVAWLDEDEEKFRTLTETGELVSYTQPEMWADLPDTVLARSLGRYILEQWGDEGLRTWLSLLPRGAVDPDVLDSSLKLTLEVPFASLLQAWYLDVDPTLQAREMWIPRLRAALEEVIRAFGPVARVYVYAGGRPTLPGVKRPGLPWRALEGEVLGVPVNVRTPALSRADAAARPDALHVQFLLSQNPDYDLEAVVMYHSAEPTVRRVRLYYRFLRREGRWFVARVER